MCVPGDAQEPPAPRMAPFPQHEDLSHPVRRCWTSSGSEGSSEEKGLGKEAATLVGEVQERVRPHQDVKADSVAVISFFLCQQDRDRQEVGVSERAKERRETDSE